MPQPWSPASDLEVTRTYEGPHLTLPNYYGVSYEVDNSFSSETCPECPTLSYLYTVYFRYPDP